MTLHVPSDTELRFSTLDFPYAKAFDTFMFAFKEVYKQTHDKKLPYRLFPPYRQLNDAILALAPGLIQAFEDNKKLGRMVAFTRYEHGRPEDFPTLEQLCSLIKHWLLCWAEQPEVEALLQADGKRAWQEQLEALDGQPETAWQHDITPASLAANPGHEQNLGYIALPALLTTLLENQTMSIYSKQREYVITWRRVNAGGKNGLYLISQPILDKDDYFAYRLDFSVQTQTGYVDHKSKLRPWVFAHLSIQRYITERYSGDYKRSNSVLVGFNREHFSNQWDRSTTLIQLGVKGKEWESGVGKLLGKYSINPLASPEAIFKKPLGYANYSGAEDFRHNEYYVVYAEGRKFGDEKERKHQTDTGMTLGERSQMMENVLSLLGGWLEVSPPFHRDLQSPNNTLALRNYDYMIKPRKDNKAQVSWCASLQTSLAGSGYDHLHITVLHRSDDFQGWAEKQITEALMGVDTGDNSLVTVSYFPLEPSLYFPLDAGNLDPQLVFKDANEKPPQFMKQWYEQMRASYPKKRDEWQAFLQGIDWKPNARRMVLIDSTGEYGTKDNRIPDSQKIKGAIRDACNREGILSQFIVGNLKPDSKNTGKLKGESAGRLKHAVLDLLLRQQAILYAPPHEIYERAAGLNAETAHQLDIIAFCRVNRTGLHNFNYVLAVRLRADGTGSVMLPGDSNGWIPYDIATSKLGILIEEGKVRLFTNQKVSPLRMHHDTMLNFVHEVLTSRLERPTIAVIEAEGWRNGASEDENKHCWTQLRNRDLSRNLHTLHFDRYRVYDRAAPKLNNLLAVVRLRMDAETPQYITAGEWSAEESMRDIPHLTSYIDPGVTEPMHFMSVAGLSETQDRQDSERVQELFKADIRDSQYDEIAPKHPQIVEMVPFFVHPDYQHDEGQRQLCRCVHFLRNSPAFVMGAINKPYAMHLGEKLIEDQLCIVNADA
jgi:hypothetical protein